MKKGKKNKRKQISLSLLFGDDYDVWRVQFFISNLHKRAKQKQQKKSQPMRCSWNWLYEESHVNFLNTRKLLLFFHDKKDQIQSLFFILLLIWIMQQCCLLPKSLLFNIKMATLLTFYCLPSISYQMQFLSKTRMQSRGIYSSRWWYYSMLARFISLSLSLSLEMEF